MLNSVETTSPMQRKAAVEVHSDFSFIASKYFLKKRHHLTLAASMLKPVLMALNN